MSEPIEQAESAIAKAVRVCGGPAKTAAKLGVSIQVVTNWVLRDSVPIEKCVRLEALSREAGEVVTRQELRPSFPWESLGAAA